MKELHVKASKTGGVPVQNKLLFKSDGFSAAKLEYENVPKSSHMVKRMAQAPL